MSVTLMNADFIISGIVEQFRPLLRYVKGNFTERINEGILIKVRMSLSDYSDEFGSFSVHRDLRFVFISNTSVFVSVDAESDEDFDAYKNTSNHDSCWRSDGLQPLSETYFEMAKALNAEREANGLDTIPPIEMRQSNDFGFGDIVKRVRVTTISDGDYHNKITKMKKLKFGFKFDEENEK